jgi:hypothetical protein
MCVSLHFRRAERKSQNLYSGLDVSFDSDIQADCACSMTRDVNFWPGHRFRDAITLSTQLSERHDNQQTLELPERWILTASREGESRSVKATVPP